MSFQTLIEDLDAAGFFCTAAEKDVPSVKLEILKYRDLFPPRLGRGFLADAEILAEGGVLAFIGEISPWLSKHGVHLPVAEVEQSPVKMRDPHTGQVSLVSRTELRVDDSIPDPPGVTYIRPAKEEIPGPHDFREQEKPYRVVIGSRSQEIWNDRMPQEKMWEAGLCHTLLLVNALLADAVAAERLYGIYGGNEARAVALTPAQFDLIAACSEIKESEKPWKPYRVT